MLLHYCYRLLVLCIKYYLSAFKLIIFVFKCLLMDLRHTCLQVEKWKQNPQPHPDFLLGVCSLFFFLWNKYQQFDSLELQGSERLVREEKERYLETLRIPNLLSHSLIITVHLRDREERMSISHILINPFIIKTCITRTNYQTP